MRRISQTALGLLALAALSVLGPERAWPQAGIVGPLNQIICNKVAQATITTATTTALVNGVANTAINICGWHVTSTQSASTTFQFVYGTTAGGPCGSPVAITPQFNVTSTAPSADHIDYASTSVPMNVTGSQLCVVSAGSTIGLAVYVYYSQF